jgi:hypothetical protein
VILGTDGTVVMLTTVILDVSGSIRVAAVFTLLSGPTALF